MQYYDRACEQFSRRELLNIVWALGAAAIAAPVRAQAPVSRLAFRSNPFTLGIASGDPLPTGVVLWTRLAPEPLAGGGMPMVLGEVAWEVGTDPSFRSIVRSGTEIARPELGHSVHVDVEGLLPGRDYWYRFHAGSETSAAGRTRTAPAANAMAERVRFAVCGCNHFEHGFFTGYRRIAEEGFDWILHTGDYIYESGASAGGVRTHHGAELYSVADYRARYAQYKLDPDLQAAHASAPFIVTWDDHEVVNDYAGGRGGADVPPEVFALRRAAGYQAYYEAMPLRRPALPGGAGMQLHRRLAFGQLVDLHVCDTRQWRSSQACGKGWKSQCEEALDSRRTMLGTDQERWLFANLERPAGRWTLLGQQVYTFARDLGALDPAARFNMDKWDGYVAARRRLYRRLVDTRTPNPIILSGDVHQHFAADLKMDFARPESETVGVELTTTSISSNGDGTDVAPGWDRVRADNPHVKYHSARRGYIACTATPGTLRGDFMVLDRVTVPGQPTRVDASVVIENGRRGAAMQ